MTLEFRLVPKARGVGVAVVVTVLAVLMAAPVGAIDMSGSSQDFSLNLDTTLSWGARYRMEERDPAIIGFTAGGTAWSVNGDDGNLNFDKGLVSNTLKATIDLSYSYNGWANSSLGFFVRGSGFVDFEVERDCCARTELTDEALDWAGQRAELLDAYAWFQFGIGGGRRAEIRAGNQVLNWGESTFIQGGLAGINPVDVSAIRVPGSELREAFRPVGMVWASFDLSQNLSVEGFYEYEWEPIVIDPPGTFFSTNDFAGRGGETVFLGFGSFPDSGVSPAYIQPPVDYPYLGVPRSDTINADDGGQYGIALRLFMPNWGGTEFGFYYLNLHSRLPTINGFTGTIQGAQAAAAAGPAAALQFYFLVGIPPGVSPEIDALAAQVGQGAATAAYADTASWYTAYPEDIKLYGLSWNAQLGNASPSRVRSPTNRTRRTRWTTSKCFLRRCRRFPRALQRSTRLRPAASVSLKTLKATDGSTRRSSSSPSRRSPSQILGADQAVFLGEFGFNWVFDMPDKDTLRFEGPGTYTSGNPIDGGTRRGARGQTVRTSGALCRRLLLGLPAGHQIHSTTTPSDRGSMAPRVAWAQDVKGVTPGPGGSFLEGRKALTVGLGFDYQNSWQIDLSYTMYSGAGRWNLINDRDFIGGFIKYSF